MSREEIEYRNHLIQKYENVAKFFLAVPSLLLYAPAYLIVSAGDSLSKYLAHRIVRAASRKAREAYRESNR